MNKSLFTRCVFLVSCVCSLGVRGEERILDHTALALQKAVEEMLSLGNPMKEWPDR